MLCISQIIVCKILSLPHCASEFIVRPPNSMKKSWYELSVEEELEINLEERINSIYLQSKQRWQSKQTKVSNSALEQHLERINQSLALKKDLCTETTCSFQFRSSDLGAGVGITIILQYWILWLCFLSFWWKIWCNYDKTMICYTLLINCFFV